MSHVTPRGAAVCADQKHQSCNFQRKTSNSSVPLSSRSTGSKNIRPSENIINSSTNVKAFLLERPPLVIKWACAQKKKKKLHSCACGRWVASTQSQFKKTSPGLLHLHKRLFRECVLCRPCAAVPIKSPSVCPDTTPIRPACQSDPPQILKIGLQPKAKPSVQKGCTAEPHFRMRH